MSGDADRDASASERALASYRGRMRRLRIAYAAAIAVIVVAGGVVVKLAYSAGEISHATLRTATRPAPSAALGAPAADLHRAWSVPDHTAIGQPYWGGTVITYSAHTVTGRDGRTGAATWSYTRTDRTVCTAAQLTGVTIAVFELNGNCNELTALDSQTGKRQWTRTLDKDGRPLDGRPTYTVGPYTFMLTTPHVIYALSANGTADQGDGGLDRWVFARPGCTINSAVLGSAGALISQTCTNPDCGQKQFCGAGPQLLLRDATAGENNDDAKNPDRIKWNLLGSRLIPVSADGVISAVAPNGTGLTVLDPAKGKTLATLPLRVAAAGAPQALQTAHAELVRIGSLTYAVDQAGPDIVWTKTTTALPTVTAADGSSTPDLASAVVTVPTNQGVAVLDGATGRVQHEYPLAEAPAAGSAAYPFGSGFVVAGATTAVYQ